METGLLVGLAIGGCFIFGVVLGVCLAALLKSASRDDEFERGHRAYTSDTPFWTYSETTWESHPIYGEKNADSEE